MGEQDDWNHRSEMQGPEDPAVKGHSRAADIRRNGPISVPQPSDDESEDAPDDPYDPQYADKWQEEFSHLPGVEPTGNTT